MSTQNNTEHLSYSWSVRNTKIKESGQVKKKKKLSVCSYEILWELDEICNSRRVWRVAHCAAPERAGDVCAPGGFYNSDALLEMFEISFSKFRILSAFATQLITL